jgi:hypothetical protein
MSHIPAIVSAAFDGQAYCTARTLPYQGVEKNYLRTFGPLEPLRAGVAGRVLSSNSGQANPVRVLARLAAGLGIPARARRGNE